MTTSERRKIFCSVTFHVIAVTCVVWSLYVLIDRTAEEIKQGNDNGKDLFPLLLPSPVGTDTRVHREPFPKFRSPLDVQVLSKGRNLQPINLYNYLLDLLSKKHGSLGIPKLGLGMCWTQLKLSYEGFVGTIYHFRLPEPHGAPRSA